MPKKNIPVDPEVLFALITDCLEKAETDKLFKSADNLVEVQLPALVKTLNTLPYCKQSNYSLSEGTFIHNVYYKVKTPGKRRENVNMKIDRNLLNLLSHYRYEKDFAPGEIKPVKGKIIKKNLPETNKMLFEMVRNKLIRIFGSEDLTTLSPFDYIAKRNDFNRLYLSKLLAAHPSIFHNLIDDRSSRIKLSDEFKVANHFEQSDGYLLCHALSIHTDSIYLLAELGRFSRFSNIFKKEKRKVFLTGKDFARLNWVVYNYSTGYPTDRRLTDEKIEDNLVKSRSFRNKLYKALNLEVVECRFDNANKGNNYFTHLDEDEIRSRAQDFHTLCKYFFKDENLTDNKLSKEASISFVKILDDYINAPDDHPFEIMRTKVMKLSLEPQIQVIKKVIERFKSCSEKTFQYFLLQYYHQFKFDNYLKIAIDREIAFDNAFRDLKKIDSKFEYQLFGAYFDDYFCFTQENPGEPLTEATIHAYYFPSGTIYTKNKKDLKATEEKVILLTDRRDKIASVINNFNNTNSLPILITDLLSFTHFFFKWEKPKSEQSKFVEEFETLIKNFDPELYESWINYTQSTESFYSTLRNFEARMMTYWEHACIIPYWHFPYYLQKRFRNTSYYTEFYINFIDLLLRALEKEFKDTVHPRID